MDIIFDTHRWKPPSMNSAADNVVSYRIKFFIKNQKKTTTTFYLMVLYSSNEGYPVLLLNSTVHSVTSSYLNTAKEV